MLTNNNEILAKIDDEIQKAEKENASLKSQLKDLGGGKAEGVLVIGDKATYRIGVSRFDRTIQTNVTFDKFWDAIKTQIPAGTKNIAYESNGKKMWLRTNFDITNMFKQHFANKEEFIKLSAIEAKDSDFNDISALKLPTEAPANSIFVYLGLQKCDFYSYIPLQSGLTRENAISFFKQINPKQKGIKLIDSDGDQIDLSNDTVWEYFMLDAKNSSDNGKFCTIISE